METKQHKPAGLPPASTSPVDWEAVAIAYCTTRQSAREIGAAHGISHTAVQKHAKAKGWTRPEKRPGLVPVPPKVKAPLAEELAAETLSGTELSMRRERFVVEYLIDLNGTKAYMRTVPGTPEKSASTLASRLLGKVEVQEAIAAERAKTSARLGLSRDRALAEYAKLAFFDIRHAYHESGALKLPHEMDGETAAAIAAYETVELDGGGKDSSPLMVRKVKWSDKRAALDSIMKAQGWNRSDVGTAENPLVIRDMTDAERAVRMSTLLQANPGLLSTLGQLLRTRGAE
ncbi:MULTISPECIES: terminase small subunit [unclassified Acidovorax]|uniref:terminase small subunit n=1 Tax=unclassified Acidovorax TaxID=2684926 RepID=UPI0028831FAD|nr:MULTISPECIES: terminase small subunit [unclassified Acidovorax]